MEFKRLTENGTERKLWLPVVEDVYLFTADPKLRRGSKGRARKDVPTLAHMYVQLAEKGLELLPEGFFFPSVEFEPIGSNTYLSIPEETNTRIEDIQKKGVKLGKYKAATRQSTSGQPRVYRAPTLAQVLTALMRLAILEHQK